ncbi:C2H2 type zinc finger domain-containing protein [Phaeosphaeriaceae sp. SRC1lsM3a]|nr:C2H2 type zinc finger domain-containing protein [Stagonospora sp. SRC1lsM3a]
MPMNSFDNEAALNQDLRTFFEQIMVPEFDAVGTDYVQPPPDLSAWMDEVEYFGQLDLFGANFVPAMDQIFEPQLAQDHISPALASVDDSGITSAHRRHRGDMHSGHIAHPRSPWSWLPTQYQHAFSEQENTTIDGQNIDLASSPHQPYDSDVIIPGRLTSASRDRIFKLVTESAQAHISIPSFPDADSLDKLIKVGIAKRIENDAWIHPYTFDSNNTLPELLTALVAAGCICFGIPAVNRTGLVLQEISRVALNKLLERDDNASQCLQYLQASMLWIDIGAFCGYKRKMMIAESNLQGLITALRHAGRFYEGQGQAIVPNVNEQKQELDHKWRQWVERESYRRLLYHLWEHDIDMACLKHRQPLISYAELLSSLPASRSLWLAPTADAWRSEYMRGCYNEQTPSLRDLLTDDKNISSITIAVDKNMACSAYLHGLAAQLWEFSQQVALLGDSSDRSSQLWLQLRQEKLYQQLQRVECSLETSLASACVLHQFLQMYAHANLDTITRFAGRCGDEEAHRAYTHLQPWSITKEARVAICHAGQVLRNARMIRPYQFRGPDSFMIYYAIMVLWTYSMLLRDRAEKGTTTDEDGNPAAAGSMVFLDDPKTDGVGLKDAFVSANRGVPGLHIIAKHPLLSKDGDPYLSARVCDLRVPSQVMEVGTNLFGAAHPGVQSNNGPPLLRALSKLMRELGRL